MKKEYTKLKTKPQFINAINKLIKEETFIEKDVIKMCKEYDISEEEALRTFQGKKVVATAKLLPGSDMETKEQKYNRFLQFDNQIIEEYPNLCIVARGSYTSFYEYKDGFYQEVSDIKMKSYLDKRLIEDGLFEFRTTTKSVEEIASRIERLLFNIPGRHFYADNINQKHYINVKNGLLDPNTQELLPHTSEYFCTSQCNFDYNPEAKIDKFDKFIRQIMCDNQQNIDLIQEVLGYCLQGRNTKHKLFYFYGISARNGKSTLALLLKGLLGNGFSSLSLETLSLDSSPLLEPLVGSVLNFSDEISGKYMDSPRLASVTAEGYININPKYKKSFSHKANCNFIVACNDLPKFADPTGILARTVIIPFNYHVQDKDRIYELERILLEEEGAGILYWMLQGLKRFKDNGNLFSHSDTSDEMYKENERINSPVLDYIESEDIFEFTDDQNSFIPTKDLFGTERDNNGFKTGYFKFRSDMGHSFKSTYHSFATELSRIASKPGAKIKKTIKQINGVSTRGYTGLKKLSDNGYNI